MIMQAAISVGEGLAPPEMIFDLDGQKSFDMDT